ncbi:hypothetical protein [Mesorhizobium comanense]|uniref:hypothetical protein n=1 Tax=Mesorhizobium comanense TaxID=2502215 RepID=UPI0010F99967|nr:hypothetical protein [Mesorhizobium comanense]
MTNIKAAKIDKDSYRVAMELGNKIPLIAKPCGTELAFEAYGAISTRETNFYQWLSNSATGRRSRGHPAAS